MPNNIQSCLVRDEEHSPEEVGLSFDASVMHPRTFVGQRRRVLVAQEAMSQLVANVAALPEDVVTVVMDDSGFCSAWDRYGRERRLICPQESGGITFKFAQLDEFNVKEAAEFRRINWVDGVELHLLPYAKGDPIYLGLEPPSKSHPQSPFSLL